MTDNIADIRQKIAERNKDFNQPAAPADTPPTDFDFLCKCFWENEMGDGQYFAHLYRGKFVYNCKGEYWLKWNGQHWEHDYIGEVYQAIESVALAYLEYVEHTETIIQRELKKEDANGNKIKKLQLSKKAYLKRVEQLRATNRPESCLRWSRRIQDPLAITGDELDSQPWLLACKNGVVDLRTGDMRAGRPDDYLVKAISHEWQGIDAPAPTWEAFLQDIFEAPLDLEEQSVEYPLLTQYIHNRDQYTKDLTSGLRRALGYAMTGFSIHHFFMVLTGTGRNGKSTLVEIIKHILKPLGGIIPSEMLLEQGRSRSSSGPSPDIMLLKGLRIAFASETDDNRRFSPGMVKWLSGGDTLKARDLNKNFVEFEPTHTLALLTNNLPYAPADDFAFWERLKLFPFNWTYRAHPREGANEKRIDPDLLEKLKKETPGILAWLVRGCLEYQLHGLSWPDIVRSATDKYRQEEDTIGIFIEDCCDIDPAAGFLEFIEVYSAFSGWYLKYRGSEKTLLQKKKFSELLQKKFKKSKIGGKTYFQGFEVKAEYRINP